MDRYDPATNAWTSLLPFPTDENPATVLNGKIYVMGENTYVNIFDPRTTYQEHPCPRP